MEILGKKISDKNDPWYSYRPKLERKKKMSPSRMLCYVQSSEIPYAPPLAGLSCVCEAKHMAVTCSSGTTAVQ